MPELPDVEVFKRRFDETALHQTVGGLEVRDSGVLAYHGPGDLERRLQGRSFESSHRHGKRLFAGMSGGEWLELHFGMTGSLAYVADPDDAPPYTKVLLRLENGRYLGFVDSRKLGHLALIADLDARLKEQGLGPDAYGLDPDAFLELAKKQRGQAKCWLMDQGKMAGIGNVYSDEILFQAGIHPKQPVKALSDSALLNLHGSLRRVVDDAVDAAMHTKGIPADFLVPHREPGGECPRCGAALDTVKACGRTAYFCPKCQPGTFGGG
ncbi:Fpg/Nei family DNA glycosylase [Thiohalorhabdus sp. Cl-TMA]|uniref:Fpg/Nei family DNA glycosylase n=1 Tax=Thiohalorhabdus methylotrophus TaxID=3242694 RepID=A0ABV4TWL8_9GAMM